jgi:hypothetical protein
VDPNFPCQHLPHGLSLQGGPDASSYRARRTSTSSSACRDSIVITITSPVNQALPAAGGIIIIQGQLTNTTSETVTITVFGFDSSAQIGSFQAVPLVNTPLALSPGEMTDVLDLFSITGSPSPHPGDAGTPALGHFSLVVIGRVDDGQLSFLGRSEFVNVGIGFTPIPEPCIDRRHPKHPFGDMVNTFQFTKSAQI